MAGQLTLRVITPEHIAFDDTVDTVRMPGVDGDMGILPRHASMVAAIEAGVLRYRAAGAEGVLFVGSGFAEVRDNTVRVVTNAGETPEDIDEERARAAEQRARERLEQGLRRVGEEPIDLIRAEASLKRALLRLRVKGGFGR